MSGPRLVLFDVDGTLLSSGRRGLDAFIRRTGSAKTVGKRAGVRQPRAPPWSASGASEKPAATWAKSVPERTCESAVSARR